MRSFIISTILASVATAHYTEGASTVTDVDIETIYSCGPTVTDCPYSSTTTTASGSVTTVETFTSPSAPIITITGTVTTGETTSTGAVVPPPTVTLSVSTIASYTLTFNTTIPAATPSSSILTIQTSTGAVVPTVTPSTLPTTNIPETFTTDIGTSPVSSYSISTIVTCIPTTIYQTIPVVPTTTPVVVPPPTVITSGGFPSGTGGFPGPSTSPIVPAIGAGSMVSGSMAAAGVMAVAAFFL